MSARRIVVLRPEPGAAATCARIAAAGGQALPVPLFMVRPLPWTPPGPDGFDALLLTSANAVRHAGPALGHYARLPVFAVGEATAAAARHAGLAVAGEGAGGIAALLPVLESHGVARALWLAGKVRTPLPPGAPVAATIPVYASDPLEPNAVAIPDGAVLLLHSARAARRLAEIMAPAARSAHDLVALSDAVAAQAGAGWRTICTAATPDDAALVAAAIDRTRPDADKRRR